MMIRKLYKSEYDWGVGNENGTMEHGDLYVDKDGVVRFLTPEAARAYSAVEKIAPQV